MFKDNLLLMTDVYKFDHAAQYPKGTTKIYSYFCARKGDEDYGDSTLFFGLQYYLKRFLAGRVVTKEHVDEFKEISTSILGPDKIDYDRFYALAELGYLPIEIKAVEEGEWVEAKNVLFTITNTLPEYYWLVNYIETLLLKVWYPTTVATISGKYAQLCHVMSTLTCDNNNHLPFQIHDFGYRATSSEETAYIGGAAHLINFMGTDTTAGVCMLREYYNGEYPLGLSVPASEHSVMCAHSPNNDDYDAILNMITQYPTGIVSIVSDTYDLWRAVGYYTNELKDQIERRDGKVVIRPDSGNPETIFLGDLDAEEGSPQHKGLIQTLWDAFGGTTNEKGYKVLNPKIGAIYGDAIYFARAQRILSGLMAKGFASSNVVFGIGGILLQASTRDNFGFSLKATYCEVQGEERPIMKAPKTDSKKNSHRGLLRLNLGPDGYTTTQNVTKDEEQEGQLITVFNDGVVIYDQEFGSIRERARQWVISE